MRRVQFCILLVVMEENMRRKKKKELIVNAFYVHNEVIEEPTCAEDSFYEVNEDPDFDYLLRFIMKSQKTLHPIFYKKVDEQEIMIFNTKHLKKIIKRLDNAKAKEKCQEIINRKARRCECCGAVILDKYMFTYRKRDGWLTKSYECSVCRGLSRNECEVVKVYKRKHGTKKALMNLIECKEETLNIDIVHHSTLKGNECI